MTSLFAKKDANGAKKKQPVKKPAPGKKMDMSGSPVDALNQAQLEELREAFNTFDEDGGGTIDKDELRKLLTFAGQTPTDDELRDMIQIIDTDGTGDINFPEFVTLMAHKMANEASEETIASAFAVFDTDGSGGVHARVLQNMGEDDITVEDIQGVMYGGKYGSSLGGVQEGGHGRQGRGSLRRCRVPQGGANGRAAWAARPR